MTEQEMLRYLRVVQKAYERHYNAPPGKSKERATIGVLLAAKQVHDAMVLHQDTQ